MLWHDELPPLDTHAHIAPDVTSAQLSALGGAQVFAVTRDLAEATAVVGRSDANVTWGCGIHPGLKSALAGYSTEHLRGMLPRFALLGEVGLDGRADEKDRQRQVFIEVLRAAASEPVLLSIHSAGAVDDVIDALASHPHRGAILHWFTGTSDQLSRASKLGCYFSVNAAMSDTVLGSMTPNRILPETDFPSARRRGGGQRPGDVHALEDRLGKIWSLDHAEVRGRLHRNLRELARASGAIERLPEHLADVLMIA